MIAVENGWYKIEVLGGEMMQQSSVKNVNTGKMVEYFTSEPTIEFLIQRTKEQETADVDINAPFTIERNESVD